MKKIILLIAFSIGVLSMSSCSSDSDFSSETVSMRVGGVQKTFDVYFVDMSNPDMDILATANDGSNESIELYIDTEANAGQAIHAVNYAAETSLYGCTLGEGLVSKLNVNNQNRLKGTFSGSFKDENNQVIVVTDGKFDFSLDDEQ